MVHNLQNYIKKDVKGQEDDSLSKVFAVQAWELSSILTLIEKSGAEERPCNSAAGEAEAGGSLAHWPAM